MYYSANLFGTLDDQPLNLIPPATVPKPSSAVYASELMVVHGSGYRLAA